MRIAVASMWPQPEVEIIDCAGNADTLIYLPLPRAADIARIPELVYRLPGDLRRAAAALVFRVHPSEESWYLSETNSSYSSWLERIVDRTEGVPVGLVSLGDSSPRVRQLHAGTSPRSYDFHTNTESLCLALREADLRRISMNSGALLPKWPTIHYEAPNGDHYESFLRLGPALQSVEALDTLAFWLVPHVPERAVLVLDSATVIAIGLNLLRYLPEWRPTTDSSGIVECLRRYDEPESELARRVAAQANGNPPVLVITSVVSSGRLTRRIVAALRTQGFTDVTTVSLFGGREAAKADVPCWCVLDSEFERHSPDKCPRCAQPNRQVIRIEPTTYLLNSTAFVAPVWLGRKETATAVPFFSRYSGTGCVSIHRDRHDGVKHHMIHLDLRKILTHPEFVTRLRAVCAPLDGQVDVVLAPAHDAAEIFGREVGALLQVPVLVSNEETLTALPPTQAATLRDARRILVVDDVVITGERLKGFKIFLGRAGFIAEDSQVKCLVGVSRPADKHVKRGILSMLHSATNCVAVEEVVLPNWDERSCPWCLELESLRRYGTTGVDAPMLAARFDRLRETKLGLSDGLFLHWSDQASDLKDIGHGSDFGPKGTPIVELFAEVAGCMQSLRSESALDEAFTTPIAKVVDPRVYELRYYDPLLTASILRAARRHDVRAPGIEDALVRATEELLSAAATKGVRSELMLAIADGKLPRVSGLADAFVDGDPEIVGYLRWLLG